MKTKYSSSHHANLRLWIPVSSMGYFIPFLLSALFILSTAFMFFVDTNKQYRQLEQSAIQTVSTKLSILSSTIEYALRHQQDSLIRNVFTSMSTDPNVDNILLLNSAGEIIHSNKNLLIGKFVTEDGVLDLRIKNQVLNSIRELKTQSKPKYDILTLWQDSDFVVGFNPILSSLPNTVSKHSLTLAIGYRLTSRKEAIRTEGYRTLATQLAFNLAITILVGLMFHFKITRRAKKLVDNIDDFIAGNDEFVVGDRGNDEIGKIARGLQKLFSSIRSKTESLALKTAELSKLNRALTTENRVRKLAETSAAELLELNQKVIDDSDHGILVCDESFSCIMANPFIAKILDRKPKTLSGVSLTTPPFTVLLDPALLEGLMSDNPMREETVCYNNMWFEISAATMIYKGKKTHIITLNDITQKKLYSDQQSRSLLAAEAANQAKSNFLANMSHEIRTPMNSILGVTELLKETEVSKEQSELIKRLELSGSNLLSLINDILDLSKIEAGQLNFDSVRFDMHQLIDETVDMLTIPATKKGLVLTRSIAEDVPAFFLADPLRIKQVLINLINNAIKFTQRGTINLQVSVQNKSLDQTTLLFNVSDTGIGMNDDTQKNLFKPFFQADSSTTRVYGGTGLGLAICRELVSRMNGKIWLSSTPNEGTIFSFTLGLQQATPAANEVIQNRESEDFGPTANTHDRPNGQKVLIIDDSEDNRFLVRRFLKDQPYQIFEAVNGQVGLEMLKSESYALALIDIQMPVMDGNTTIKLFREWELTQNRTSPMPIIVLTANAMKEDFEHSLSLGANSYITKPISKSNLISEIKKLLGIPPSSKSA